MALRRAGEYRQVVKKGECRKDEVWTMKYNCVPSNASKEKRSRVNQIYTIDLKDSHVRGISVRRMPGLALTERETDRKREEEKK